VKEDYRPMALQYHSSLSAPMSEQHAEKWKTELKPSEISKIEYVAEAKMKQFGYVSSEIPKPFYLFFFQILWAFYSALLQGLLYFILLFPPGRRALLLKFVYKLSKLYKKLSR